jgi:hypothetical protein
MRYHLNEAIHLKRKSKSTVYRWYIGAAAILILVFASFSTAYIVSAQFQEWVISLFQIKEAEQVPKSDNLSNVSTTPIDTTKSNANHISLFATNTIDDIFAVQYLKSDHYVDKFGPLFYYSDGQGLTRYYTAVNNEFVPVKTQNIKRNVTLLGITGKIDYTLINYNGQVFLSEYKRNRFMLDDETDAEFNFSVTNKEDVWLWLYKDPMLDNWSYPAKYDLNTGKTTDVLHGITVDGMELSSYPILQNWDNLGGGQFLVSLGNSRESCDTYLINIISKKATSLSKLTGLKAVTAAKIFDGKIMLFEPLPHEDTNNYIKNYNPVPEDHFNYYCYDITTGQLTKILENAKYWSPVEQGGGSLRVHFIGGRYDFIEDNYSIYLIDCITGKRMTVEGITEELAESSMINSINNEILVSSISEDVFSQIGVIDLESKKLYLLNRKNPEGIHETSISWSDATHISINATDDDSTKSYVYLYSLIK